WGIKEPEDLEKDPLISRDAIYHASTVLMPDEHSVTSAYQDAIDDLDRKKRPKSTASAASSSSSTLLPLHSDSSLASLLPQSNTSANSSPPKSSGSKARVVRRDDIKTMQSDYYRSFRTQILLLWIVVNGALVITISSDQLAPYLVLKDGSNLYVTIIAQQVDSWEALSISLVGPGSFFMR
ncbi:hypothetical protein EDD11_008122, partial [Mortierella claussenii]